MTENAVYSIEGLGQGHPAPFEHRAGTDGTSRLFHDGAPVSWEWVLQRPVSTVADELTGVSFEEFSVVGRVNTGRQYTWNIGGEWVTQVPQTELLVFYRNQPRILAFRGEARMKIIHPDESEPVLYVLPSLSGFEVESLSQPSELAITLSNLHD